MPVDPKTGKKYPYTDKGIEQYKKDSSRQAELSGGMPYVPFKMKGSPMQRNFGIGSPTKAGVQNPRTQDDPISQLLSTAEGPVKDINPHTGTNPPHTKENHPKANIDFLKTDYAKGQGVGPRIPKKDKTKEGENGKLSKKVKPNLFKPEGPKSDFTGVEHPDAQYPHEESPPLWPDQLALLKASEIKPKNKPKEKTLPQKLQEKKDRQKVFQKKL